MKTLQLEDGKMIPAHKYGQAEEAEEKLELTEEELKMADTIKVRVLSIVEELVMIGKMKLQVGI